MLEVSGSGLKVRTMNKRQHYDVNWLLSVGLNDIQLG